MLRRSTTAGLLLHRQCLSSSHRPLSQHLLRNPTHQRCPFSSLNGVVEEDHHAFAEGGKSQPTATVTNASRASASASVNDAIPPITIGRTRTRSLRPILIPPTFPSSQLLPVTSVHELTSSPPIDQNTETDPSSSTTIVTLTGLPPNTVKTDISPVFQRFGEVTRIYVQPDGRRADVVFADAHGVKRTLHAYAETPLRVRGREIIVFRKHTKMDTDTPSRATRTEQGRDGGAMIVSNFPPTTTQEELLDALEPFGKYEKLAMRPGSKAAYLIYSNEDRVKEILTVHRRVPITVRGQTLRIEHLVDRPYSLSPGTLADPLELGKPRDSATSRAILEDLTRTVYRFKGSHNPSRVLWIGGLPSRISQTAFTNFWSRLGCVVDVRPTSSGYAHVEFASIEDALRAVRQGTPHGFRYKQRLLDVDFAPWVFYVGPMHRVVYISGWPASDGRPGLLQWANDIPNIDGATVLPPFRGEDYSDPRGAFLRFRRIDDARTALRLLEGRVGPGGDMLHVGLSRLPAVDLSRMWRWIHKVQDMEKSDGGGGEACLEDEWGGLGFGTGDEEQDDPRGAEC